jgi:hypothetical protein
MKRPLIQIDDIGTTREMNDEEYSIYQIIIADHSALTSSETVVSTSDAD